MDDLKNLIDLSSPENKANEANKNQPLIPCPSIAPLINNPFDSICELLQVATDDPFEAVLNTAMCFKKVDNNKEPRKNTKRNNAERDQQRVSTSEAATEKVDQVNKVSSTNNNLNNSNIIKGPSSALTNEDGDDENKENIDPCPPKELGKNNNISSYSEGKERPPLSEISIEKLSLLDESCPPMLNEVDETQHHDEIDDLLTGPLKTDIENDMKESGKENGMKGKCQSVPMLFIESNKSLKNTANSTFCCDFDGLEGFKPLSDLVNSSSSRYFVNNEADDPLSVTCDQMNTKGNFKTWSAPSLSTPNRENAIAAHQNFSSDLSPVLNGARASPSSIIYDRNSLMNRAMILSKTGLSDDLNFSFSSRKIEYNTIINSCDEENDDVFVEAKILAQSFSEAVPNDNKIEEVADLFSIELNLVYANSSDEENDSLRNDPSLNFNFTSSATRQKNLIEFSDAVKKYKKRRSTESMFFSNDELNESQDNSCQKKSASFSSSETPQSKSRNRSSSTSITAGLNILKKQIDSLPIGNNNFQVQKPKKYEGGVNSQKSAPLKATVPLQFMIRSGINKNIGIDEKTVAIKPVAQSKVRAATRMKAQKNVNTPRPVASSTPNKNKSMNFPPGQNVIMEDNHNNRSLDSSDAKKTSRSRSLSSTPSSDQSFKTCNGKVNSTPSRNGLSIRNSMPTMKQNNKKLSTLSRNSPNFGVRNSSLLSPSSTSLVRKYGKRSI